MPESPASLLKAYCEQNSFQELLNCLPVLAIRQEADSLLINFPHPYFQGYFCSALKAQFEEAIHACICPDLAISYGSLPLQARLPNIAQPEPGDLFKEFLCSSRNRQALETARETALGHAKSASLLIQGPGGSGKSHLLRIMAKAIAARIGSSSVWLLQTSADLRPFSSSFWSAPKALLIDNLERMPLAAQESLCDYLDGMALAKGWSRLVIANGNQEFEGLSARLARRLQALLAMELFPADLATKIAYAEKTAQTMGLALTKKQIVAISRQPGSFEAIQGILQKIRFHVKIQGQLPELEEIEKFANAHNRCPAWQTIVQLVGKRLQVSQQDILGPKRKQEIALARQIAMYLCRISLGLSFPELGALFGGRDHTTALHGVNKIQELRQVDKDLHNLLTELELQAGFGRKHS